jgi:hypothetical protein
MHILFNHATPRGIARSLSGHTVSTAYEQGWDRLTNGLLLSEAERANFELLLTTDRGIRYQQNLSRRKISLVVLTGATKWSRVRLHLDRILTAVNAATPGSYSGVEIPYE